MKFQSLILGLALLTGVQGYAGPFERQDDMRTIASDVLLRDVKNWVFKFDGSLLLNRGNVERTVTNLGLTSGISFKPVMAYLKGNFGYGKVGSSRFLNKAQGVIRLDYFLEGPFRIIAFNTNGFNEFLNVDYRNSTGIGPWWDLKGSMFSNGLSLVISYEHQRFSSGVTEDLGRLSLRNLFSMKFSGFASVGFDFFYVPAISDFSNYRIYFAPYIQTSVWREVLGLKYTVAVEYDSRPQPGIDNTDIEMTVSFTFTFDG